MRRLFRAVASAARLAPRAVRQSMIGPAGDAGVTLRAEIPNPDGLLRPDMSGDAKVETVDMPVWISYTRAIMRSKESVLKNNLYTMRTVIDEYTYDKQKAPQTLQDLVSDGYLRQIPADPITGNADSWKLIMEDASNTVNQTMPGIYDIRSGAEGTSLEGTPYGEW